MSTIDSGQYQALKRTVTAGTPDAYDQRVAGFRQQSGGSLNVNYPLWDHPGDIADTGCKMRTALQRLYDQEGLGSVPVPIGSAGGVSEDHLTMLEKMKPELFSFHFGLPDAATVRARYCPDFFALSVMRRRLPGFDPRMAESCSCIFGLPLGFPRYGAGGRLPDSGRISRPGTPRRRGCAV